MSRTPEAAELSASRRPNQPKHGNALTDTQTSCTTRQRMHTLRPPALLLGAFSPVLRASFASWSASAAASSFFCRRVNEKRSIQLGTKRGEHGEQKGSRARATGAMCYQAMSKGRNRYQESLHLLQQCVVRLCKPRAQCRFFKRERERNALRRIPRTRG